MKGSIDDIKEAEKSKTVPGRTTYQTLATLLAEHARLDALEHVGSHLMNWMEETTPPTPGERKALSGRLREEQDRRRDERRHAAQQKLEVNGVDNIRGAMKGIKGQLSQMSKGKRVEALRAIGAALRPFCPEAADYLESVE